MPLLRRVLHDAPVADLAAYRSIGGGAGLAAARGMNPADVVTVVTAAGLRGRGGAGFPTGVKWDAVRAAASAELPTTVVVNAAEGEPSTFKDRAILRTDPYQVLEGALIAAHAAGAPEVVVAMRAGSTVELERVRAAIAEVEEAQWADGVAIRVVEGPEEYLFGEETALLEVLDGRPPFPRVQPPYRRGVVEVVDEVEPGEGRVAANDVELAGDGGTTGAPPALVDNVETLANVTWILANGADWFREVGTEASPGTIVVTVTGAVRAAGVAEVPMGTTLREAIELAGGGPLEDQVITGALLGVSGAPLDASALDVPLTYESMAEVGAGLGAAGFQILDGQSDVVATVAGASRFLAVESCGQCEPCKRDGLALAELLDEVVRGAAPEDVVERLRDRTATVADGARCALATQQQVLVDGLLDRFPEAVRRRVERPVASEQVVVADLVDLRDGRAVVDQRHADKQPDWSFDDLWSGSTPAELANDHVTDPAAAR